MARKDIDNWLDSELDRILWVPGLDQKVMYDALRANIKTLIQEAETKALNLTEYDGKHDLLSPEQRLILKRYHYVNYKHLEDLERGGKDE